jgi:hypothetical protein
MPNSLTHRDDVALFSLTPVLPPYTSDDLQKPTGHLDGLGAEGLASIHAKIAAPVPHADSDPTPFVCIKPSRPSSVLIGEETSYFGIFYPYCGRSMKSG